MNVHCTSCYWLKRVNTIAITETAYKSDLEFLSKGVVVKNMPRTFPSLCVCWVFYWALDGVFVTSVALFLSLLMFLCSLVGAGRPAGSLGPASAFDTQL